MNGSEKKEKKKFRFNLIDFIIIIAVIGVAVGVVIRYDLGGKLGVMSNKDDVIVSFLVQDIKPSSASAFQQGDTFTIISNSTTLGELISVSSTPAEKYYTDSEGKLVLSYDSEKVDVRGTIKANGTITSDGFMLGGTQYIGANKELYVKSKNIMVTIVITGITPADSEQ